MKDGAGRLSPSQFLRLGVSDRLEPKPEKLRNYRKAAGLEALAT